MRESDLQLTRILPYINRIVDPVPTYTGEYGPVKTHIFYIFYILHYFVLISHILWSEKH